MIVLSELISWAPFISSIINLAAITVERYLKVVHAVWAKKKLNKWVMCAAIAFTWIAGTIVAVASVFPTTAVLDGKCRIMAFFNSPAALQFLDTEREPQSMLDRQNFGQFITPLCATRCAFDSAARGSICDCRYLSSTVRRLIWATGSGTFCPSTSLYSLFSSSATGAFWWRFVARHT